MINQAERKSLWSSIGPRSVQQLDRAVTVQMGPSVSRNHGCQAAQMLERSGLDGKRARDVPKLNKRRRRDLRKQVRSAAGGQAAARW